LQVRQLAEHNWHTFAIDYPQQSLDPNLEHVPYYTAYSVIDGDIYFNISHIYPLLVSLFYKTLGIAGLPIVAVLGGVLTAVAIFKLSKLTELPHPEWLLWITIFATPSLFYSLSLWDHTLATACAAWAVYGISKSIVQKRWQPAFWGGIVAGLGLAQRPEMYLFTLALGLGVLIYSRGNWRHILIFILGGTLSTFVVWGLQYLWVGHPLGLAFAPNFSGYGRPTQYTIGFPSRPPLYKYSFLLFYVEPGSIFTFVAMLLILIGIIIIVFSLRIENLRRPMLLLAGSAACIVGYGLLMYWARYGLIPGLISTFPLIALSLTFVDKENGRYTSIHYFVFLVTLLFIGGMLLIWPAYGGGTWGARYLLPAYPLLVFLAYYTYITIQSQLNINMQKTLRYTAIALLITSVVLQFIGVRTQYFVRKEKAHQRELVASLAPEILITDKTQAHVPLAMVTLTDKLFFQTGNSENQQALFAQLQANNAAQFGYITRADDNKPELPNDTCYIPNDEMSLSQCGRESSCWVFQLSANCKQ
jgi:hypothetical protein